jgi:hypothetical protein
MSSFLVLDFEPVPVNVRDREESTQIIDVISGVRSSSDSSHVMASISAPFLRDIVDLFRYDREGES